MRRALLLLLFSVTLFLSDFILKSYVHNFLPLMSSQPFYPYGGIGVFENFAGIDFSIIHVLNKGAAWGMLSSFQQALFYGRLVIIGIMLFYLFFFSQRAQHIPLLMIITGALGNVADHLLYGHVIDMFYFRFFDHSFPVFNIADSLIFCGIVYLMFLPKRKAAASPA